MQAVLGPRIEVHVLELHPVGAPQPQLEPVLVDVAPAVQGAGEDPRGMTACPVDERTQICPRCQNSFIRTNRNQKYCKRPECIKEGQRAYNAVYQAKKNGSKVPQAV